MERRAGLTHHPTPLPPLAFLSLLSLPHADCLDSIPRIQRVYQRLTVLLFTVLTPFTSVPRYTPPNGPDSAASIFVAAWWRRQQARPKVESGRTEPSTCWLAGCLHTTSNQQAGSSPASDLAYRPNSPNACDFPDKPVLLRPHGLPVCQSAGSEWPREWRHVAVFVLVTV